MKSNLCYAGFYNFKYVLNVMLVGSCLFRLFQQQTINKDKKCCVYFHLDLRT